MTFASRLSSVLATLAISTSGFAAPADSAQTALPIAAGAKAPAVVLKSADGLDVDLGTVFPNQPTLLIFYRGGWCPYCSRHLAALGEVEAELLEAGYRIIGISPDKPSALQPSAEKAKVDFTLLSDRDMAASSAYGLAFKLDAETLAKYRQYGFDLAPIPGGSDDDRWLPVPAVYIVGRDGLIKFAHANPDYKSRISPGELLAAARATK